MGLKDLSAQELEEKFENFIFHIDDYLEDFIERADEQGYDLDYSIRSLSDLEDYLTKNKIDQDSDDVNDAAAYFGEVVRTSYGGNWICSLDKEHNSLYYGKPVITGHTEPKDLQLSPFDSVLTFVIRPRENHFFKVLKNHIDPKELDLDKFPTEKG